jgi:tRNA pseudouridine38-40 synthase
MAGPEQAGTPVCAPQATYQAIIAYDGTGFAGFQRLPADRRTVQGTLEQALRRLGWSEQRILAAGRTDRGVHARGQVIAFTVQWDHPAEALTSALNAHLPSDVAVRACQLVPPGFHPRFDAVGRQYSYSLLLSEVRDPLRERTAWRRRPGLEIGPLREAAALVTGRRDFGAFGLPPFSGGHTVRHVRRASWEALGDVLRLEIEADAFLRHMVRRLVGAMVGIAQGSGRLDALRSSLDDPSRMWSGSLAPPHGLCLERVFYPAYEPARVDENGARGV